MDNRTLVEALGACHRETTGEQRAAVQATITSGHGVQVIEALAGTDKTVTAGLLAYVYRRSAKSPPLVAGLFFCAPRHLRPATD